MNECCNCNNGVSRDMCILVRYFVDDEEDVMCVHCAVNGGGNYNQWYTNIQGIARMIAFARWNP